MQSKPPTNLTTNTKEHYDAPPKSVCLYVCPSSPSQYELFPTEKNCQGIQLIKWRFVFFLWPLLVFFCFSYVYSTRYYILYNATYYYTKQKLPKKCEQSKDRKREINKQFGTFGKYPDFFFYSAMSEKNCFANVGNPTSIFWKRGAKEK